MFSKSALLILALCSTVWTVPPAMSVQAGQKQPERNREAPPKAAKTETGSMTGCVDEQEGRYVLVDDRSLSPIANLEAEGFPTEGFAKHVGNKVTVRGIVNSNGPRPVVKVRSIEKITDGCKGQQN
jgi:hypothetical protein